MDLKETIKGLFAKHNVDPKTIFEEETKLAEAKLETGEVIVTESEWAIGATAMLQTEDGTMALGEGAYKLEDGTEFTVDADGVILTWGEVEEEEMSEEPLTKAVVEDMIKSAVSTMFEELSKIEEEKLSKAEKDAKEANEKAEKLSKELKEHLESAAAESSRKPKKVEIQKDFKQMSKQERMLYAFNSRKK